MTMEKTKRQISLETELQKAIILLYEMKASRTIQANYFVQSRYEEEKDLLKDLQDRKKEITKQEKIISSIRKDINNLFPKS